jgi:hypothetical protein
MGIREKIGQVKWKVMDALLMAFLVVLSLDILYLYYRGAWYDPYKFIEISEVVLLYAFSIVGTVRIIIKFRELIRHINYS